MLFRSQNWLYQGVPALFVDDRATLFNDSTTETNISLNASGTNLSTTQNAGGGAAHNNMPPYLQLNFIVKYQ